MAGKSRRKGAVGEREVAALLREAGLDVERNLAQVFAAGQADLNGVTDGWGRPVVIEVKRYASITPGMALGWWVREAVPQAAALDGVPVLAYRANQQPWTFRVPLAGGNHETDWADLPAGAFTAMAKDGGALAVMRPVDTCVGDVQTV